LGLSVGLVTSWNVRCGIASYSKNLAEALAEKDINVYIIRVPRFGTFRETLALNVARKTPKDKIDLVHVQHEYGIWKNYEGTYYPELKSLGLPVVTTMHGVGSWKTDQIIADYSDRVIVHNQFCAERYNHPCYVIAHGSKPQYEMPDMATAKKSMNISIPIPVVGYCGFISDYKGLESLIDAMALVPNAVALIAGGWYSSETTSYISNLKQSALKTIPGRCQFVGYVADGDLPRVYAAMDIVVYPSRYATESGALIMALSHGRPVIASDIGPFREKRKQGALWTFKNYEDLAKKIRRLIKSRKLKENLSAGARKYTDDTSWDKIAELHKSFYLDILEKTEK